MRVTGRPMRRGSPPRPADRLSARRFGLSRPPMSPKTVGNNPSRPACPRLVAVTGALTGSEPPSRRRLRGGRGVSDMAEETQMHFREVRTDGATADRLVPEGTTRPVFVPAEVAQ